MLPSSLRRVAVPPRVAALASALAPSSAAPVFVGGHQRRCSSSKPSRPDNGPGDVPAGQSSVPASSAPAHAGPKAGGKAAGGKAAGDKRKRKNKEKTAVDRVDSLHKLPSVPATNHMSQESTCLSSFFSLHRPMSITQTMPRSVSHEHFASIFSAQSKASKMAETISTISDTVNQLQGPMAQMTIDPAHDDELHARADGMRKVDFRNPDGSETSLYLQVDAMSGDFVPFRPPPPPGPESAAEAVADSSEVLDQLRQHRVYNAMFTIEEVMEPNGQMRIVAHSPVIVDEQSRSLLSRMAGGQLTLDEAQARRMYALSVKRQRKLKMKKKKYKKLMRRTRNLRRKLDRT